MNALQHNRFTEAWRAFGASVPRPRAILVVSAHWYINASAVTAMSTPRTIHDFFGFPDELYAFRYPAPGSPELADEVVALAGPVWVGLDVDSWGIDHGAWSVLAHVFPSADIPVVQLSVDATKPLEYHLDLAARLAPLRDQDVLVIASGNIVHNLPLMNRDNARTGFDWAQRFDRAARGLLTASPQSMADLEDHPDFPIAVPTPDHLLPCLYLAGIAAAADQPAAVLTDGYAFGSLSMASYTVGVTVDVVPTTDAGDAGKPPRR